MFLRLVVVSIFGTVLLSWGPSTRAAPAQQGLVIELPSAAFAAAAPDLDGTVWTHEVNVPHSTFILVHFGGIVDPTKAGYVIEIRDAANRLVESIAPQSFSAATEHWSVRVSGSYALVSVRQVDAAASLGGLHFAIDRCGVSAPGGHVLSLVANHLQPAYFYYQVPGLQKAAKSVARLTYIQNGMVWSCSGFMISDTELVTAAHCISDTSQCNAGFAVAEFGYQYLPPSAGQAAALNGNIEQIHCIRVARVSGDVDASVLTLEGQPGSDARWGHLQLAKSPPQVMDPLASQGQLWLIGYPDASEPERVSQDQCRVTIAAQTIGAAQAVFGHTCDTMEGSSGSPVVNSAMEVVGIHFQGFVPGNSTWDTTNAAVVAARLSAGAKAVKNGSPGASVCQKIPVVEITNE